VVNLVIFNLSIFLLLLVSVIFVGVANNFDQKFIKHIFSILVGLVFFILASIGIVKIDKVKNYALFLWIFSIFILVLNLFVGTTVNGSRSWIYIGNFSFQPAELTKLSLVFLFVFLYNLVKEKNVFFFVSLFVVSITILPIFIQPDLGFSVLLFLSNLIMNYGIGVNGFLVLFVLSGAVFAGSLVMKPYQVERLTTFLDPYKDPLGNGWQTIQSVNCIINGGIWGQGIGKGMISKLGFLPEKDTDFIFSLITEEVGLIGALFIILLFITLIICILLVFKNTDKQEYKIISLFVAAVVFIQSFINVAMNTMSGPITGLPLPLISYGGTNMVITLFLLGLINQINLDIIKSNNLKKWIE